MQWIKVTAFYLSNSFDVANIELCVSIICSALMLYAAVGYCIVIAVDVEFTRIEIHFVILAKEFI